MGIPFTDSGAETRRELRLRRRAFWSGLVSIAAMASIELPALAGDKAAPPPPSRTSNDSRWVGVFTGEFVNGVPVYRFPPITVVANRDAEFVRMREEDADRPGKTRAKVGAPRPEPTARVPMVSRDPRAK